jgi:hypothetical protein
MAAAAGPPRSSDRPNVFSHVPNCKELLELMDGWSDLFGDYTTRIDLKKGDLSAVCLPTCTLTTHAPLWGKKPGQDKAVPVAEVRKNLSDKFRFMKVTRQDVKLAMRKNGTELCLFFVARVKLRFLPFCAIVTAPLIFVVKYENDERGALKIASVDEWAVKSATIEEARKMLVELCFWPPVDTTFAPFTGPRHSVA